MPRYCGLLSFAVKAVCGYPTGLLDIFYIFCVTLLRYATKKHTPDASETDSLHNIEPFNVHPEHRNDYSQWMQLRDKVEHAIG